MGFSLKRVEIRVTLAADERGRGDEIVIRDLPCRVSVVKPGGPDKARATVEVTGMAYADMERLTTLSFRPLRSGRNLAAVCVGDDEEGLSLAFAGEIVAASADFSRAPDVAFVMDAMSGYYPSLLAEGPQAVSGSMPAADFIARQAAAAGYAFENHGVTAAVRDAVFNGSPVQKARACAAQIGATLLIDDNAFVLLAPGATRGEEIALVSPENGLLGYPTFSSDGIEVRASYRPSFRLGGLIRVSSVVPRASGLWRVVALRHEFSAGWPGRGRWETRLFAAYEAGGRANSERGAV